MEKTEAEKILKEKLETAEKILVGIGSEWKKKEGTEVKRSFMPPKS